MTQNKELIIHIGVHKTGSTAIQHFFWRHDEALRERGVLYPRAGRPADPQVHFGHHDVPWALTGSREAPAGTVEELRQEIAASPFQTVVISSEEFDRLDDRAVAALREALPWPARIVFYYRRQSAILQGAYGTQVIAYGDLQPIDDYARDANLALDFTALAQRWAAAFGREAIVALPYRRELFPGGNIVPHFLAATGLEDLPVPEDETFDYNPSLPWYAVETIQRLWASGLPQDVVRRTLGALITVCRGASTRNPFMPPSAAHAFDAGFADSNARFQAEYAPDDEPLLPAAADGDEAWHAEREGPEAALQQLLLVAADYVELAEFNATLIADRPS